MSTRIAETLTRLRWAIAAGAIALVATLAALAPSTPAVARSGGVADLIDTDVIDDVFIQVNDRAQADRDTWSVRFRANLASGTTTPDVVGDCADGLSILVSKSAGGALIDQQDFDSSECTVIKGGVSLVCKNDDKSIVRLRGTAGNPSTFRVTSVIKKRELDPHPYTTPLTALVECTSYAYEGEADVCDISHNGERTTCRLHR